MATSLETPSSVSQSENVLYHILSDNRKRGKLLSWSWSENSVECKQQGHCIEPLNILGHYNNVLYSFKVTRVADLNGGWTYLYQSFFNDNVTCLSKGWAKVQTTITQLVLDGFWFDEGSVFMDVSTLFK